MGLNDRAFLVEQRFVCELLPAPETSADDDKNKKKNDAQPPQGDNVNAAEIQAVAVSSVDDVYVWCVVSRYDKSLSIYRLDADRLPSSFGVAPTTVYKTVKRVLCLCFADVPYKNDFLKPPLHVVIAGDLVGDATTYSLSSTQQSKVLLGHTASMLTGVQVVTLNDNKEQYIFTSDRDEKIRISDFPQTNLIDGYLLGHSNYITSMDVLSNNDKCVSCGGDGTVRLWNYATYQQVAEWKTTEPLPTRVTMSPNGKYVVVIYDASNKLDILSTTPDGTSLQLQQSIECPVQPLSVKFITNDRLLVLMREPEYLVEYKLSDNDTLVIDSAAASTRALQHVATSSNIVMPISIMEVDKKSGQVKMQKEAESRGVGNDAKPWDKVERIQTAKEATKRRDKRRRLEREENEVKPSED